MQRMFLALLRLASAGILLWSLVAQAGYGQQLLTLRYGQNKASAKSVSSLNYNVALRKGFLSGEGIRLEIIPAESSTYEPIEKKIGTQGRARSPGPI